MKENPFKSAINAFKKSALNNYASFRNTSPDTAIHNLNEIKYGLAGIGLTTLAWVSAFTAPTIVSLVLAGGAGFYFNKARQEGKNFKQKLAVKN